MARRHQGFAAFCPIGKCLDLGCGTGRFTASLAQAFGCPVVGVEPSEAMLGVARAEPLSNVEWKIGSAEAIPLEAASVGLVFMSQVFHHFRQPQQALTEIYRVLTPGGYLIIRNGTEETNEETEWFPCFPEAVEYDRKRIPSRQVLEEAVCSKSFDLVTQKTFRQLFAPSYRAYYAKIGGRGLSSLLAISDTAFESGMERFKAWTEAQPPDQPVYEPIDVFVFRKK